MPTVLDELLVETRVNLAGLQTGIREAERMAAQARGSIAQEFGAATFQVNVSDAVSQIRGLAEATTQLHASLTLLRAQLAQPFKVSVDTSELRRAARDIAEVQAAMAGVGAPASARAATASSGGAPPASVGGAVVVRGSGASTPIVVSGPVVLAGGGGFGGMIPPTGGARFALPAPMGGFGPTINMAQNAAGVWRAMPPSGVFTTGGPYPGPGMGTPIAPGQSPAPTAIPGAPGGSGLLGQIGTSMAYAAAFSVAFKVVSDIRDVWNQIIDGGREFNAQMETGKIGLASLLAQSTQFQSASGKTADIFSTYQVSLGRAAAMQERLMDLDAETLGSGQDLVEVHQKVLAFSRGQTASDEDRLRLTQGITNAAKLFGLTQDQIANEARQILTLERNSGQQILQNLGVSIQEAREWKNKGVLVEELNKRLEIYVRLGKDAGQMWQGLTTTIESLTGRIAAVTGRDTFTGLQHGMIGAVEEMKRQRASGEVFAVPLGVSDEEMRATGAALAALWLRLNQSLVEIQNGFIRVGVNAVTAANMISSAWANLRSRIENAVPAWMRPFLTGEGLPATPGDAGIAVGNFLLGTPAGPPPNITESIDTQSERLAIQLNSLAKVDTSQMSSRTFGQFMTALAQGQDAARGLKAQLDQLHGTNQITAEDYARQANNLNILNAAYDKAIAGFEKGVPLEKNDSEALTRAREAAVLAADQAELALAQRRATITGDTAAMQIAAERKLEDERDKSLRRAGDDVAQRQAIWRKFYADKANLEIDAAQRDIANSRRVGQIDEQEAQRKLRAIQEQGRAQEALVGAQLSSTRRTIGIAQSRGAGPDVLNPLFGQERALVEQQRQIELRRAQEAGGVASGQIATIQAQIAGYQRLIAVENQDPVLRELYKERLDQLNNLLITWQSTGTTAATAIVTANEKAANSISQIDEYQRRLNRTVGERVHDRLTQDAQNSADRYADIWVSGIDRVSDSLADMVMKGKFNMRSLLDISNEISREIMSESIRGVIRQGLGVPNQMPGGPMGGIFDGLFGGGSNKSPGVATVATTATTGIQQITATGTTGLTTLQTTSTTGITQIHAVASAAISAIQAQAGAGGTFGNVLSGGSSTAPGGGLFGNVLSGGSSTAPGGGMFGNVLSGGSSTAPAMPTGQWGAGANASSFSSLLGDGGILSIIYQLGSLIGGATGSKTGGLIGGFFGGITGLVASLFHDGGFVPHFASGGFAGNEVPAILHRGEMVLSAGETRNLLRYGSARMPSGGGISRPRGGDGPQPIVNFHIHTPDADSFRRNQSQILTQAARQLQHSGRRNL